MRRGFSLLELSIVLVILGLLTGGILAGRSLQRAALARNIVADFNRYNTAVKGFETRFDGLPGDLTDATSYWGIAGGTTGRDTNCYAVSGRGKPTCNGNGDGMLLCSGSYCPETNHAWKHLANAGLISGTYTGVQGSTATVFYGVTPNESVPGSRIDNAGYSFWATYEGIGDGNWYPTRRGNLIMFGLAAGSITEHAAIAPRDAQIIDSKIDDGFPGLGFMRSHRPSSLVGCASSNDPNAAEYRVAVTGAQCNLYWYLN